MKGRQLIDSIIGLGAESLDVVVQADHGQDPSNNVCAELAWFDAEEQELIHENDIEEFPNAKQVLLVWS